MSTTDDELDPPAAAADAVSTGAAAESAEWDDRFKGLPRVQRYAMLFIERADQIPQRLMAETTELCPQLPENIAWAASQTPESALALAAKIDHLAASQNNPDLRGLADCVRLVSLPLPRNASYFDDYRRVGKALVIAFQVIARQHEHVLVCDLECFTFGWAALPACTDLLPRNGSAAASAAYLGNRIAEHRILEARGVGPATMLNFFVTFTNTVKVPLVLVGTPKADKMFSTLFREARRASEDGNVRWDRMAPDGGWKFFIEDLWPFQWTTHPTPLTDELSQAMYFETQGITALAVRLYQLVQLEAIRSRKELITKKLISDVAAENFILLKPALTALREGKVKLIAKFDDFFSQWSEEIDAKLQSVSQQSPVISSATRSNRSLSMRLKKNLMELGVPPNEIEALVRKLKASRAADDGGDDALVEEISAAIGTKTYGASLISTLQKAKADGSDMAFALEKAGVLVEK